MVALLSIVVAVVLLVVTVYGLHRYQTMEVEYNVDRSMPLPPLEGEADIADPSDAAADADPKPTQTAARPAPGPADGADAAATGSPAPRADNPDSKPAERRTSDRSNRLHKTSTEAKTGSDSNWLQQVAALKNAQQLDQAMSLCEQNLPLWGAYNQACIILRTRIKDADPEHREALLTQLYHLAATAELLHDKAPGSDRLSPAQLKTLNLTPLQSLQHPYSEIGYAQLRLVRKSDVKLFLDTWGRPAHHVLPRQFHADWWQEFSRGHG